jgi:uncharacterized membrane protein
MDLTPYLGWIKFLHVVGAFLFVAGHGVSMTVAFRLRNESDGNRMLALLDLSGWSLNVTLVGLLVILISGIVSGIGGGYFGQAWIWIAIVLLVVIAVTMTPTAGAQLSRIRRALGQRTQGMKPDDPDPVPLPMGEVMALTHAKGPEMAAAIGGIGFLVILWLMIFKPF